MKVVITFLMSRDTAVRIATGYGLDGQGVGIQVPIGTKFFSSPRHPNRFWSPPRLLCNGTVCSFLRGKAAAAWSWLFISKQCRGQEYVDLYIHIPILLHGIVLDSLSTGPNLPFLITSLNGNRCGIPIWKFGDQFVALIFMHLISFI
jgi:hypothetical protein